MIFDNIVVHFYKYLYWKIVRTYFRICHFVQVIILKKYIIVNASVCINPDRSIRHFNLGDDLNIPLIEGLTGKKVVISQTYPLVNVSKLLAIGSIIEHFSSRHAIIWGSGAIRGDIKIREHPGNVLAVRGKLTKQYLESQGVECPNVFGDPALLTPLIFNPQIEKKYEVGFIPHFIDYDLPHVKKFREEHPEILFIKFQDYGTWQDVISQICSCKRIVSSSLHGLILSDAYNIPNVWVRFSNNIIGGEFKYRDYFSGVNREYVPVVDCTNGINYPLILNQFRLYRPIHCDLKKLMKAFPFKIKSNIVAKLN